MSRTEQDGLIILRGIHDGYTRISSGLLHERAVVVGADWIVVADWLHGTGRHTWRSRVHFHPDVVVTKSDSELRLHHGGKSVRFMAFGNDSMQLDQTEMFPAFGERLLRSSVLMFGEGDFPMHAGFVFTFSEDVPPISLPHSGSDKLSIGSITLNSIL